MKYLESITYAFLLSSVCAIPISFADTSYPKVDGQAKASNYILLGHGYSTDSQKVVDNCFNTYFSHASGYTNDLEIDMSQSYQDMTSAIRYDASIGGSYEMFSLDAKTSYLKSIEEEEYSMSLLYWQACYNHVNLDMSDFGTDMLNTEGKAAYAKFHPHFRLICGDKYIQRYAQGAILLMSLNMEFRSKEEKEEFKAYLGGSVGNIFAASGKVEQFSTQYNSDVKITIKAHQEGGDATQLTKILQKGPEGYYLFLCDLKHMSKCTGVADGLFNYAKNDFPNQFNVTETNKLVSMGPGFIHRTDPSIRGIDPGSTYVDKEVAKNRLQLSEELEKYTYYYQRLDHLLHSYAVAWDENSDIYKAAYKLWNRAKTNIDIIIDPDNIGNGARVCFEQPYDCTESYNSILSRITPITTDDLKLLDGIKYKFKAFVTYYPCGDDSTSWKTSLGPNIIEAGSATITDTEVHCKARQNVGAGPEDSHGDWWYYYDGTSKDGIKYIGTESTHNNNVNNIKKTNIDKSDVKQIGRKYKYNTDAYSNESQYNYKTTSGKVIRKLKDHHWYNKEHDKVISEYYIPPYDPNAHKKH